MRIYRPWYLWECYKAGFYNTSAQGLSPDECKQMYADFLADLPRFNKAMEKVRKQWVFSCEHFLTNQGINRIAWMGQASMCLDTGVPACFRAGFKLLSLNEQRAANYAAADQIEIWESTPSQLSCELR